MDVVGDCDAEEASSKIARLHPDIVLTGMPGIIRSLKRNLDYGDVIVLAESLDRAETGAASYLLKDVTRVELVEAIRQVYSNRPLVVKEAVELVIPPPDNAAQLLRFMCQLGEILDNSASIQWEAVSRDCDTVITILTEPATSSSLLIKLANMPEVDKVEELAGGAFSSLPKRFGFLLRLGIISPSKRFSVTMEETGVAQKIVSR
ncbi:unnamed protein product [marine sediment metagenome]|uniref:Uncharacterized protein n=1 Tax=marine sediment metagenome TaxID=412755 RepID=X1SQZ2_9ZZZZ